MYYDDVRKQDKFPISLDIAFSHSRISPYPIMCQSLPPPRPWLTHDARRDNPDPKRRGLPLPIKCGPSWIWLTRGGPSPFPSPQMWRVLAVTPTLTSAWSYLLRTHTHSRSPETSIYCKFYLLRWKVLNFIWKELKRVIQVAPKVSRGYMRIWICISGHPLLSRFFGSYSLLCLTSRLHRHRIIRWWLLGQCRFPSCRLERPVYPSKR